MKKSIWIDVWDFLFPRYCAICGQRLLRNEKCLCLDCLRKLPRTNLHTLSDNVIEKNLWGRLPVERASSFLYYSKGGSVQKLLFELKYYHNADIGIYLGRCMASELLPSGFFEGIDYIVPVPLHPKRLRERGYNQSEMLSRGISDVTHIPLNTSWIQRKQATQTQTHKSRFDRWENVKDVFQLNCDVSLEHCHLLLVDDVMTTGATLTACADVFRKIPGLRISVLTLALAGES